MVTSLPRTYLRSKCRPRTYGTAREVKYVSSRGSDFLGNRIVSHLFSDTVEERGRWKDHDYRIRKRWYDGVGSLWA